jgi:choline dehydrogenase
VVADLPGVGDQLNDHYFARLICAAKSHCRSTTRCGSGIAELQPCCATALYRRGYFAIPALSAGCFLRALPSSATPDVQCSLALYSVQNIGEKLHSVLRRHRRVHLAAAGEPRFRADLIVRSADAPAIHPNYLGAQRDRDTMVAGVKARAAHLPVAPHGAPHRRGGRARPGCDSDDALLDFIRRRGSTVYHPVSTCRMGRTKAVVDERLRVRGFSAASRDRRVDHAGGRVRQHQRRAIMIAEKGADMVLEDAKATPP